MSLNCSKEIKEDAFFHAWSQYINAVSELDEYEVNYEKGFYNDLSEEHTSKLWDHYKKRVEMLLYIKCLVHKDMN